MDYLAFDPALLKDRLHAKTLCHEFNMLAPVEESKKAKLLKQLPGEMKEALIEPIFFCDYGFNIRLGNNFYANHHCVILDAAPVNIGDSVMFGPNVTISTVGHPLDATTRNSGLEFGKPITIGNNVWLGANVTVNPGVSIGDNVVIGSGSVVTKNIPANTVAVGTPCTVIKTLKPSEVTRKF